jgi:hypothetical protein
LHVQSRNLRRPTLGPRRVAERGRHAAGDVGVAAAAGQAHEDEVGASRGGSVVEGDSMAVAARHEDVAVVAVDHGHGYDRDGGRRHANRVEVRTANVGLWGRLRPCLEVWMWMFKNLGVQKCLPPTDGERRV